MKVLLEATKKAFDFVAVAADFFIHFRQFQPAGMAGNHGFEAMFGTVDAVFVAVVGGVGQHLVRLQVVE